MISLKIALKLEKKKYSIEYDMYLIFGKHIIKEVNNLEQVFILKGVDDSFLDNNKVIELNNEQMSKFKSLKTTPQYVGVCKKESTEFDEDNIVGINKITDPGNLGTIIRTAKAFGINNIFLDDNSVDIYNSKVIQAMQGVHFSMNIKQGNLFEYCKKSKYNVYTTFIEEEKNISEQNEKFILILGSEAQGVEKKFKELKRTNYRINIQYESLNVGVASGIMLYELKRRNDGK